ncbi:MAG: caspase family protein [Saprospiraceae bacterium]
MKTLKLILLILFSKYSLDAYTATYALVIGINDYKYQTPLGYAREDAVLFYDILKESIDQDKLIVLLDKKATKANVSKYLKRLSQKLKPSDQLIFYFAGHGTERGFLCYDGYSLDQMMYYTEFKSELQKCRANNKFIFIDACKSGNLFLNSDSDYQKTKTHLILNKLGLEGKDEVGNYAVFMSCDAGESSSELKYFKHGIFTYYLSRGILGLADEDNDKRITIKELYYYIRNNTYIISKKLGNNTQCPILIGNFDQNLIFANTK